MLLATILAVLAPGAPGARVDPSRAEAFADYSDAPDGAVPGVIASGQEVTAFEPEFTAEVRNGALTSDYEEAGSAAAYFGVGLARPVTEMGVTFSFEGAPVRKDSVGLIAWTSALDSFPPAPRSSPVHFTINPVSWAIDVFEEGRMRPLWHEYLGGLPSEQAVVAEGMNLPTDGTPLEAEWQIEGETVTVYLPNGEVHTVTDPAIGEIEATWPTPELYYDDGAGAPRVAIRSWWANAPTISASSSLGG